MYHFIEGILEDSPKGQAVLNVSGVGYLIHISDRTEGELFSLQNKTVRLYTYLAVREDAMELYGFLHKEEKEAFLLLTTVSGVGAKAAMAILSALTPDKLAFAILADDAKSISSANGIGLKTAQKIIFELKEKVAKDPVLSAKAGNAVGTDTLKNAALGAALSQAVDALVVLGYPRAHVLKAAGTLEHPDRSVEELIRALLLKLGGN